ncbi:Uncharacterized protein FWK35_00017065, partial [Aphis craccivora]
MYKKSVFYFQPLKIGYSRIYVESKSNSERSDECIDFTMIITSRNNAPISNFGGGFRCNSEYSWYIIKVKRKFYAIPVFDQIDFFLCGCNSKTNHCKYLKFSPNTIEIFDCR